MAAKTGSSYSSVPNQYFWEIPTARYMFSCTAIQVDMSAASPDITRQRPTPKQSNMAAGKSEVVTSTFLVKIF